MARLRLLRYLVKLGSRLEYYFGSFNGATCWGCRTRDRCRRSGGVATNCASMMRERLGGSSTGSEDAIVITEVFAKKTATTPAEVIKRCKKRLSDYDKATG